MTNVTFKNLLEDFELLESWEDRYRYIIDLGNDLEPFPEEFKTEQYRVLGCASQVWFYPTISTHNDQKLFWEAYPLCFVNEFFQLYQNSPLEI